TVYRVTKVGVEVLTVFEGHHPFPEGASPEKPGPDSDPASRSGDRDVPEVPIGEGSRPCRQNGISPSQAAGSAGRPCSGGKERSNSSLHLAGSRAPGSKTKPSRRRNGGDPHTYFRHSSRSLGHRLKRQRRPA